MENKPPSVYSFVFDSVSRNCFHELVENVKKQGFHVVGYRYTLVKSQILVVCFKEELENVKQIFQNEKLANLSVKWSHTRK